MAVLAAERAAGLKIDEKRALTAALFHDCAKNLPSDSPRLEGFTPPSGVPAAVVHQYAGAYVAEHAFGISDGEILDAIRYHTSGRENMSLLGKLIFLADMLESGRDFEGVEELRAAFWKDKDSLDECLYLALSHMLNYLADEGKEAYPLTRKAYEFIEKEIRNKTERRTNNV
ncbi:MAG: bis(5'-nucleosyl)-tetraphosphatase (symmetrical) YqeK [Christensenellaceae bacterium]